MPKNQAISVLTLTVKASATVASNRFVTAAGAQAAANSAPMGVSRTAAANGEAFAVDVLGVTTCVASAAISENSRLNVAANGTVATASSTHPVVGVALEAAAAANDEIRVLLIQT